MLRGARYLGAVAVLAIGAVHLQEYAGANYSAVPTIGTLFLLNATASAIVGIGLLVPLERRLGRAAVGLLALSGVAIAAGSLIALFISESGTLFGFSESGYGTAIVIAIVVEVAALVLLAPAAAVTLSRMRSPEASRSGQPGSPRARASEMT